MNVYSSYAEPVHGRYALVVDDRALTGRFAFQGGACASHRYPVDARNAFTTSVHRTLAPLVDEIELSQRAVTSSQLDQAGLTGVVFVRGHSLDVDLVSVDKLFDAQLAAEVGLTASLLVDDRAGRALGVTLAAEGEAVADAGSYCSGGKVAIERAVAEALEELARQIGDRIVNSARIRGGQGQAADPAPLPASPPDQPPPAAAEPADPGGLWIDRGRGQRQRVF